MIYTMNTKTFMKVFSKEDPKKIEKTQFVIISKRIRKNYDEKSVILCRDLFPPDILLADYRIGLDPDFFEKEYKKYLDKHKLTLAVIIKGVIEERIPVIFLCTYKEWGLKYMKVLSKYVKEEFGYPLVDYKKYKLKKEVPTMRELNLEACIERCNEVIESETKRKHKELMKTPSGRKELVVNMSTEEMKKTLKKMNIYSAGLDRHTMKELLYEFFVR